MHNLAVNLERSAALFPNKVAIRMGEENVTFSELNTLASNVATHLVALGLKPGDKVALSCPNVLYFPIAYYGILKAGCIVVTLNVLLKQREITYHLNDCDAKAYLCFDGTEDLPMGKFGHEGFQHADACQHFIAMPGQTSSPTPSFQHWLSAPASPFESIVRQGDDTAVILYTSGTTGQPKGAELSHSNMMTNAMSSQNLMRLEYSDTAMATLPLFHSFGQTVIMNASILTGATMVLVPRFEPNEVMNLIVNNKVSVFAGVPTMYIALLRASEQSTALSEKVKQSLRVGISGGSALPLETIRQFESRFELPILEGYGLSETAPVATFNHIDSDRLAGSVGQPLCGHMIKIIDLAGNLLPTHAHGEICVKSPSVMKGYFNRPEATKDAFANGWFKTGDIGYLDAHCNLFIVDRVKDMIIRGGYNVYPREIEEVMMCHPSIDTVAVIGEPHERLGEEIHAHVILKADADDTSEETLVAWCKEQLADYKYPRRIIIRQTFPMTATGKILKRELHQEQQGE
ncbi:long-chain-fatty-acid--CoA ligase [Enterovibrio norvegicus]|uniref:long-chain-fatty-acid--CoA ligase n=1 Tax=Enterovibrio norvegicus TaxID=188144 RepID=UPI000C838D7B|nr:long-chain fatty acid--CoA ligase [Enterovibrio norvegicus]PMN72398.1 long-chain-fatty-acid--CoA ligase [Enterovibrio norvegicus]